MTLSLSAPQPNPQRGKRGGGLSSSLAAAAPLSHLTALTRRIPDRRVPGAPTAQKPAVGVSDRGDLTGAAARGNTWWVRCLFAPAVSRGCPTAGASQGVA
jgi:hypothetical protein